MTYIIIEKGIDVTISRSIGVVYQNTTNRPLEVSITGYGHELTNSAGSFHDSSDNFVSDDNVVWDARWGGDGLAGNTRFPLAIVKAILPGYYYKLVLDFGSMTVLKWIEAVQ